MKNLLIYSSLTGNTKMIAEAVAEVVPNCEIFAIEDAPEPETYGFIAIGYWVDRGLPDAKVLKYFEKIENKKVALFGTLGAYPDSEHGKECIEKSEALLKDTGKNNTVLGSFLCQGKVDPKLLNAMEKMQTNHPMTEERKARIEESKKHPNTQDCENAREMFRLFVEKI